MKSSDFRLEARKKLEGKWGKVAIITLAYFTIFFLFGFIRGFFGEDSIFQSLCSIAISIIEVPLAFGLINALFKVFNSEDVQAFDFFSLGFNNFAKSWKISLHIFLKLIIPIILIIVSMVLISSGLVIGATSTLISRPHTNSMLIFALLGFVLYIVSIVWTAMQSYYYSLAYIISADRPELEAKQAVEESKKLMIGNRSKLFCLHLSFIGWAILAAFTFGIGYLWLLPYIQFSMFAFYKKLTGNNVLEVEDDNQIK